METDSKSQNQWNLQPQLIGNRETTRLSDKVPVPGDFPDYDMSRGRKAYIFNHDKFQLETWPGTDIPTARLGSSKDRDDLRRALEFLNFNVESFDNLTAAKFRETIAELARMDYSQYDCLLVVVMSHGENGKINAYDLFETYDVTEVSAPFMPNACLSLAGKPKLFFFQACRGFKNKDPLFDEGTAVSYSAISDGLETTSYSIPTQADFLFVYSTMEGYGSLRSEEEGSFFIQWLCKILSEQGRSEDLLSMMTTVLRKVATNEAIIETTVEGTVKEIQVVQMPCFTTQLIGKVYFPESNWSTTTNPKPKQNHFCSIE